MSDHPAPQAIVYLAQGKLRVKTGADAPRTLDSAYGNSIREKEVRAQQRHSWKGAGGGASPFSGAALWGRGAMPQDIPLAITSVCGGGDAGALVYSLESGSLCALLEAASLGAEERRLWNDNRTRIRHLAVSRPAGDLACSIIHENGTANIGLKIKGESGVRELTVATRSTPPRAGRRTGAGRLYSNPRASAATAKGSSSRLVRSASRNSTSKAAR